MLKCAEMTFENWSGHSSIKIIGPLHYSKKKVMDLNYLCCRVSLIPNSFFSPLKYYGHSLQAFLADGAMSKPRCLLGCACRMLSWEQPLPQGSDVGSTTGNLLPSRWVRLPKDCLAVWLLLAGNILWVCVWGGRWNMVCLLRVSSRLVSSDVHTW